MLCRVTNLLIPVGLHMTYLFSLYAKAAIQMYLISAGGVEGYLVPPSDLAQRLIKTAYLAEGKNLRRESDGVPEELDTDQMLLLLVHLKVTLTSCIVASLYKVRERCAV